MEPTIFSQIKAMFRSLSGVLKKQDRKVADLESADKRLAGDINKKMDAENPTGSGSFSMGREEGSTIGKCSHAEGGEVEASGNWSHAEGYRARARGSGSHAEGGATVATGEDAHAEGSSTYASGASSHAEGYRADAVGEYSHAEGTFSYSYGEASHAEGKWTTAFSTGSHSEGTGTNKLPRDLQGTGPTDSAVLTAWEANKFLAAKGLYSHAEGKDTLALAAGSHAEGLECLAGGNGSHAEGTDTETSHTASHAEGNHTKAINYHAHAEGFYATASGDTSHAEGYYTTASGQNSHAEGKHTIAAATDSHVQGRYNVEDTEEKYAHIVGNGAEFAPANAHTLGWDGTGWFAGGLKIGGTGQDDPNAVDVLTTADVSPVATSGSWNDLGDKPFGEEVTEVGGDTLAWDGNTNGRYVFDVDGAKFVHVSDVVLTPNDFENGAEVTYSTGNKQSYTKEDIIGGITGKGMIFTDFFLVVPHDNHTEDDSPDIVIEKKGVYFYQRKDSKEITLTIHGYEGFITRQAVVKPLDGKYIPDTIARVKDIPTVSDIIAELPIYNGEVEEV